MKKVVFAVAVIASSAVFADEYVSGYTRSDGTYVQGHYRSTNDGNRYNNYSTQGNTNPYTGQQGTVSPYDQQRVHQPLYQQPPQGAVINNSGQNRRSGYR